VRRMATRRHAHGAARMGAAPLPPSRARHALECAAQAQRVLRGMVLALLERAEQDGRSAEWLAELLGISATTLRRWRAEQGAGKSAPELRGARPFDASIGLLRALVEFVEESALMGVRALHRAVPDIPRRWLEWLAARVEERRQRRAWRAELVWTRPGSVWTMDHTELEAPIDGEFPFLFVVRDLASGRVLTALPTRSTDHAPVVEELRRLFELWGAPLVLKSDNGSGLVAKEVRDLLDQWAVTALRSPPLTPTFNGAVEAGMGSLKAWIAEIAAQHGRTRRWTRDDLEAALCAQRAFGAPRGATASPDETWRARKPITRTERESFLAALATARTAARDASRVADCGDPLRESCMEPIIERRAVRTVLTDLEYLVIRRP
jgi:hypothetical protein